MTVLLDNKEAQVAAEQVEKLFRIVGDLSYEGYRISLCRIKGGSYMQCAQRLNITKRHAQSLWEKCTRLGYDIQLKEIFGLE